MKCTIPIKKIDTSNNTLAFNEQFFIQNIRTKLNGLPMIEELHRHEFFFILVLKKGQGKHEIDFKPYIVKDYCLFFIKPRQVHQLTLQPISTGYLLHFNATSFHNNNNKLSQLLNKVSLQDYYSLDKSFFEKIYPLLISIDDEYTYKKINYEEIIRANLNIFFTMLTRSYDSENIIKNSYTQERFQEFTQFINANVTIKKQVSEYARIMNLSIYQLNTITKSETGKTCSDVIKEHIILEAKRYLLATSNQIKQIAFFLGYEDVSYFIRFFKKQTGFSPQIFRQNFK